MAISPPVLGCLVKKGLQKGGGSGAPQDPPAKPLGMCKKSHIFFFFMREQRRERSNFSEGALKFLTVK